MIHDYLMKTGTRITLNETQWVVVGESGEWIVLSKPKNETLLKLFITKNEDDLCNWLIENVVVE